MKKLQSIGLIAFDRKKQIEETIGALVSDALFSKQDFYCSQTAFPFNLKGMTALPEKEFLKAIDVLVSFGGDGTFISAARLAIGAGIPLVGVNMGGLGFLTDVPARNAKPVLKAIFDGHYSTEKRSFLDVEVKRNQKRLFTDRLLNDTVVKGDRLFKFTVDHGTKLLSAYTADGLIVSTPTGSTAYSMAAGGPIVCPTLDCVIVTPICSHSLTQKPIVTSIHEPLCISIEDKRALITMSVDGKSTLSLKTGDEIHIRRSRKGVTLLKPLNTDYYERLREKLNWGRPE